MTDRINPNRKNRLSPKDVLKRTAALTLLLSTVACTQEQGNALFIFGGLFLCILGPSIALGLVGGIIEKIHNTNNPPSDETSSPVSFSEVGDNQDMYHQQ